MSLKLDDQKFFTHNIFIISELLAFGYDFLVGSILRLCFSSVVLPEDPREGSIYCVRQLIYSSQNADL